MSNPSSQTTFARLQACCSEIRTAPCHLSQIEDAIKEYEWATRTLEDHTTQLKRQRNELLSISRIPQDVLIGIFHLCGPAAAYFNALDPWNRRLFPGCLAFSQVCYSWRMLALETPSLWTLPYLHRPRVAKEMLLRSRNAPLTIMGLPSKENMSFIKATISDYAARLKRIWMVGEYPHLMPCLPISAEYSTPILKEIMISLRRRRAALDFEKVANDQQWLKFRAPRLETLILNNCTLHWSSYFYTAHLTRLVLRSAFFEGYRGIEEVLKTLNRTPNLSELGLENMLTSRLPHENETRNTEEKTNVDRVVLSRLKRLHLREPLLHLIPFLQRTDMPSVENICIHKWIDSMPTANGLFEEFFDFLASPEATSWLGPSELRTFKLHSDEYYTVHRGADTRCKLEWTREGDHQPVRMVLAFRVRGNSRRAFFRTVVHHLPTNNLNVLDLSCAGRRFELDIEEWEATLARLSYLRRVKCGGDAAISLLDTLTIMEEEEQRVPPLEHLDLYCGRRVWPHQHHKLLDHLGHYLEFRGEEEKWTSLTLHGDFDYTDEGWRRFDELARSLAMEFIKLGPEEDPEPDIIWHDPYANARWVKPCETGFDIPVSQEFNERVDDPDDHGSDSDSDFEF